MSGRWVDACQLILSGQMHPEAIVWATVPTYLRPIFQAATYLAERTTLWPITSDDVWTIASERFGANEDAKLFLAEVSDSKRELAVLETVRDSMVLRATMQKIGEQLQSGQYDLEKLRNMLEVNSDRSSFARKISPPNTLTLSEAFHRRTGIRPLDEVIGGVKDELILVSARPKDGKSNFFANLIAATPKIKTIYITIMDYDYDDYCRVLNTIDPAICKRDNLWIYDYTSKTTANLQDVEGAISSSKPEFCIVDRAEEMVPIRAMREKRWEQKAIFKGLRGLAKKYNCTIWTDHQLSDAGGRGSDEEWNPFEGLAEDKTGTIAVIDLMIALRRQYRRNEVMLKLYGRRAGMEKGQAVTIHTDRFGRYQI